MKAVFSVSLFHPLRVQARRGVGIAFVPNSLADDHIASGRLQLVLDDWSPFFDGYFLYYPTRRQNLPVFKVIVDALRHRER